MSRYEWIKSIESSARTYAATFQQVFESGRGLRVFDETGNEKLDCLCCAGALPLGHNNTEVRDAVIDFLLTDHVQQALDLSTPAKFDFLKQLFAVLPPEFAKSARIQFCSPSGSDAVEAALKLVRYATGRQTVIAFHGAYHGMTGGALAAMGNLLPKSGSTVFGAGIHFAPYPYRFRCPFGGDGSETDLLSLNYLKNVLTDPESGVPKPACVIVEVIQGEGGCVPASDEWLRGLRSLTRELDIPLVIDEVQTGFGRTGHMFAFQSSGIVPDVLVLSKAIGGGYPLSVVLYHESLDKWPRGMHAGTFRGNQIAMVAGRVTMSIILRDGLEKHAANMGSLLANGLNDLKSRYSVIGDIRGRGLMQGIEIVAPQAQDRAAPPDGDLAGLLKQAAFRNGLIVETGGRHGAVIRMLPPLIITSADVGDILDRLESSLAQTLPVRRDYNAA